MQNQKTSLFKEAELRLVMCCMQDQTMPQSSQISRQTHWQVGRKEGEYIFKNGPSLVNHHNKQGGG